MADDRTPNKQEQRPLIDRIVSGGQTGVDRAALDFAIAHGLACGGWVPKGRRAEDGIISVEYLHLQETESEHFDERTVRNVRDSDGTLLITRGAPAGGSAFTLECAARLNKPVLHIDVEKESIERAQRRVREWLQGLKPAILNIAGPRHSEDPGIYALTRELLEGTFRRSDHESG